MGIVRLLLMANIDWRAQDARGEVHDLLCCFHIIYLSIHTFRVRIQWHWHYDWVKHL
jgi:hypothetical protein